MLGLLLFVIFGNSFLFNSVMRMMEPARDTVYTEGSKHAYAVVLGGYADYNERTNDVEFYRSIDRLTEAMDLYNKGAIEKIILSSGVCGEDRELTEAEISKKFLVDNGIDQRAVHCENHSWNTHMNALYSAQLVDSLGLGRKGLLITSAYHMKRAMACYKKEGFELDPYPADYFSHGSEYSVESYFWPSMHTVIMWDVPIKELVGRMVYSLKGYT